MKNTSKLLLLSILLSSVLFAQNTVEDLENLPVVADLAPSVIDMPIIEDETIASSGASLGVAKHSNNTQENNQSTLETVNGVIQKRVKKSKGSTITKFDEEAPEADGLEPAGVTSL